MCLLFTRTAGVSEQLSDDWLKDFYSHNKDGFGVMYAEDGILWTQKGIGTVEDWIKFYRKHEHRTAAFHLRMRTHGHIDLTNCHPYEVYGDGSKMPVYLMHNGILHTGNHRDNSKSDTWHFIRDYVIPLTKDQPKVIFTPEFEKVIGKFIGNNRFAMMNQKGEMVIVNKDQGVEWKGMWLSNTYAWDYYKAFPRVATDFKSRYHYGNDDTYALPVKQPTKQYASKVTTLPKTAPKKTDTAGWFEDDMIAAFEDIAVRSKQVAEKVTGAQLERLFKEFGASDAWSWIEAFSYSQTPDAEKSFIEGMQDPRKIKEWLNAQNLATFPTL